MPTYCPLFLDFRRSAHIAQDDLAQPANRPAVDRLEPVAVNPQRDGILRTPAFVFGG